MIANHCHLKEIANYLKDFEREKEAMRKEAIMEMTSKVSSSHTNTNTNQIQIQIQIQIIEEAKVPNICLKPIGFDWRKFDWKVATTCINI